MGQILPKFRLSVIEDIKASILAGTSNYYGFAADPITTESVANTTADIYSSRFIPAWRMQFGKKLFSTDIMPVVTKVEWASNTVYDVYDNNNANLESNTFYVMVPPTETGGTYHYFKCLDNANGANSTEIPDLVQSETFTKSDGYKWRYICSCTSAVYDKFSTTDYTPIYPNTEIVTSAFLNSGIEVVTVSNVGMSYDTYKSGNVQSFSNSTLIQIENSAPYINDYYTDSAILVYEYGGEPLAGVLRTITSYEANSAGRWIEVNTAVNTASFTSPIYKISPRVVFDTDGEEDPLAYTEIDSSSNTLANVVILNTGYGISRANVSIVANSSYGSDATVQAIVPSAGGHGSNPESELFVKGFSCVFSFSNTEYTTIPVNTSYNKIGIIKNPYAISQNTALKLDAYTANTFTSYIEATISPANTFTVGDYVFGNTSGAKAIVAFSNSTVIYLTGDKDFTNGEYITSEDGDDSTAITITTIGDIYCRDLIPLYIENISDVERSSVQTETFKLILKV